MKISLRRSDLDPNHEWEEELMKECSQILRKDEPLVSREFLFEHKVSFSSHSTQKDHENNGMNIRDRKRTKISSEDDVMMSFYRINFFRFWTDIVSTS